MRRTRITRHCSHGAAALQVVAVLLQLQMKRLQDPAEHGVVLILGANEWQRALLKAELQRLCPELSPGHSPDRHPGQRGRQQARQRHTAGNKGTDQDIAQGTVESPSRGAAGTSCTAQVAASANPDSHIPAVHHTAAGTAGTGAASVAAAVAVAAPPAASAAVSASEAAPARAAPGAAAAPAPERVMEGGIPAALPVDISNEVTSQDRMLLYATRYGLGIWFHRV